MEHLASTYAPAIRRFLLRLLAGGRFAPLSPDDADDLLQDFFVRLLRSSWFEQADPARGRFRSYLAGRVVFFVRERRADRRSAVPMTPLGEEAERLPDEDDPLVRQLDAEVTVAATEHCLRLLARRNPAWCAAVTVDLERDGETDAELAARLGWSLRKFTTALHRGRRAFREAYVREQARLDGTLAEGPRSDAGAAR